MITYDRADLTVKKQKDGSYKGFANLTRVGVFKYLTADGSIRRDLRHPDHVFATDSMETLKLLPIVVDHPDVGEVKPENYAHLSVGSTGDSVQIVDRHLGNSLAIIGAPGIEAVEKGKRELSLGYDTDRVFTPGTYDGEEYDCIQTNIRYNHLAIVNRGRAGRKARLNITNDASFEFDEEDAELLKRSSKMVKVTLDNLEYEAAPEVANALDRLQKSAKDSEATIEALKKSVEDSKKALDSEKAASDVAKAELEEAKKLTSDAAIQALVVKRLGIIEVAKRVLTEKSYDALSNAEIVRKVVQAKFPKLSLDGKSEDYIQACFDNALFVPSGIASQRSVGGSSSDSADDWETALAKAKSKLKNLYKGDK